MPGRALTFRTPNTLADGPCQTRSFCALRGLGRFPRRLFTLPVTSLRLVAVPLLAGIASIEILYFLWLGPLTRGGTVSIPFVTVLLAALIVFYLWALWTLERAGSIRLFMLGAIAIAPRINAQAQHMALRLHSGSCPIVWQCPAASL